MIPVAAGGETAGTGLLAPEVCPAGAAIVGLAGATGIVAGGGSAGGTGLVAVAAGADAGVVFVSEEELAAGVSGLWMTAAL